MICFVDALGESYLMPCLAQDPNQTKKQRESHKHYEIRVLDETIVTHQPSPPEEDDDNTLLTSKSTSDAIGLRKLLQPVDFNNANITEEELTARLAAFDVVKEVHEDVTLRYKKNHVGPRQPGLTLVECVLDCPALTKYKVPLCFREIDDDLEVIYNEKDNLLDKL